MRKGTFLSSRRTRQPRIARWALCVLFAAIVTLAVLQYSFRHGRLITVPTYDDIGYFADGAERLESIYQAGFPGLWQSYMMQPPHSPFESLMATSAFALFGMNEWAPYVLNGLIALGYFLLADWLLRGVRLWAKFLCFIIVASLPFVGMAVHEFRPDNAVALFTAIGVLLLLSRTFIYGTRRRQIWAGVWLGIAMLTKPPVFPQTLVLGFAAIFLATISDWAGAGRRPKVRAIVAAWARVLIPFLLIPLPHYYHARDHIFSYIHDILFGTFQHSYEFTGTLREHLLYFLTGVGGSVMLGRFVWILLAMLVAGGLVLTIAGTRRDRFRVIAMILVVLLAWLIPTVNKTKSAYFGLGFDTLAAFSVLFVVARVLVSERVIRRHTLTPSPGTPGEGIEGA
jgi:4-amino-4-deoxy-L-arabinose transferase-like glycosyltransferase